MLELRPFRVLEYLGDLGDLEDLVHPERKPDDRSQFVRFARVAAQLAEWDRAGKTKRSVALESPEVGGFTFGIAPLESLNSEESHLPAEYAEAQRLLEATQIYFSPIVVTADGTVIGNKLIYAAAIAFQAEVSRPGKVRASDFALVAVASGTSHYLEKSLNSTVSAALDIQKSTIVPAFGVKMWSLKDF